MPKLYGEALKMRCHVESERPRSPEALATWKNHPRSGSSIPPPSVDAHGSQRNHPAKLFPTSWPLRSWAKQNGYLKIATQQWVSETCWVASMCPSRATLHLVLSLRVPDQCISGLHTGSSHWEPLPESGVHGTVKRGHFFPSLSAVSPQTVCISAEGYRSSQGSSGSRTLPFWIILAFPPSPTPLGH